MIISAHIVKNRSIAKTRHTILGDGTNSSDMKSTKAFRNILLIVGLTLAELRKKKGYATIKEFANRYDLPEIQYWRIEKGKANITLKTLVNILSIHHLSLYEFFCLVMEEESVNN